jgi:predicted alpha/beta superfamily hydrolase
VIVVGVASVDRRNELALRSSNPDLMAQYPTQGDSARFRRFLAEEVIPFVEARFATDGTSALMGESLAGLFVVETALKTPSLFDAYVAVSPSLWWDDGELAGQAASLLAAHPPGPRTVMLSIADEGGDMQAAMDVLVAALRSSAPADLTWTYDPRPDESHASIYHGAALDAFRALFPFPPEP